MTRVQPRAWLTSGWAADGVHVVGKRSPTDPAPITISVRAPGLDATERQAIANELAAIIGPRLSDRELNTWRYIATCLRDGTAPTLREIAARFNVSHTSSSIDLERLEAAGVIRLAPRTPRAIQLLRQPTGAS